MRKVKSAPLSAVLLSVASLSFSQNGSRPSAKVTQVQAALFSFTIRVSAPEKDLVVPYCSKGDDGTLKLCYMPDNFQVETPQGWQPVKLRFHPEARVLGRLAQDLWKVQPVTAGRSHEFSLAISKVEFAVERGQRVRYIVDAWPDEKSMRNGGQPIRLVTPPFKCP